MTSGRRWLKSLHARRMVSATALSTATKLASPGSLFTAASAICIHNNNNLQVFQLLGVSEPSSERQLALISYAMLHPRGVH